jgi:hypothetical protein
VRSTKTIILCDLDAKPTPATTTVKLAYGKRIRKLDLCEAHAEQLEQLLIPFMDRIPTRTNVPRHPHKEEVAPSAAELRAWAAEAGFEVAASGRIPTQVKEAYLAMAG